MSNKPDLRPEWGISNRAIVKILVTVILVGTVIKLYPLLVLIAISILLACTLYPAIESFEKGGLPHWAASLVVSFLVLLVLSGVVLIIIPTTGDQFTLLLKKFPEMQDSFYRALPDGGAEKVIRRLMAGTKITPAHLTTAGTLLFGAVTELILIVILALYLAADGKRAYQWIRAFFSPLHRAKIDETARESSRIIEAYVLGQLITSLLCGVFVFAILYALHVPAALVLAVMAAVFDVLPILGFFLFTVPAVFFAWTVSSSNAVIVLLAYIAYHFIENYFIVPKVYGNRLRLSDLVVILAVLGGTYLAGIPGAILVLPLVAVYPAFEHIWLVDVIGREVIKKHEALETLK